MGAAGVLAAGSIDYCLPTLVPMLLRDVTGEVAAEREVAAIAASVKESRSCKSLETLEMVARVATFEAQAPGLVAAVAGALPAGAPADAGPSSSSRRNPADDAEGRLLRRLQELLRRLVLGFSHNPTAEPGPVLLFVHGVVTEHLGPELQAAQAAAAAALKVQGAAGKVVKRVRLAPGKALLVEFGLSLLHAHLKRGRFDTADAAHMQMLDPFVGLLDSCLATRNSALLSLALKCVTALGRLPLPAREARMPSIASKLFAMMQRAGASTAASELAQTCFRSAAALLRDCPAWKPRKGELRLLLTLAASEALEVQVSSTAFSLAKALVARRVVMPEMYDLADRLAELAVQAHDPRVRASCRAVLHQFLLQYPLGEQRLRKTLQFFLAGLSYKHADGRLRGGLFLLLPIAARLGSDPAPACKRALAALFKELLARAGKKVQEEVLGTLLPAWLAPGPNAKPALRRLAAQVPARAPAAADGAAEGGRGGAAGDEAARPFSARGAAPEEEAAAPPPAGEDGAAEGAEEEAVASGDEKGEEAGEQADGGAATGDEEEDAEEAAAAGNGEADDDDEEKEAGGGAAEEEEEGAAGAGGEWELAYTALCCVERWLAAVPGAAPDAPGTLAALWRAMPAALTYEHAWLAADERLEAKAADQAVRNLLFVATALRHAGPAPPAPQAPEARRPWRARRGPGVAHGAGLADRAERGPGAEARRSAAIRFFAAAAVQWCPAPPEGQEPPAASPIGPYLDDILGPLYRILNDGDERAEKGAGGVKALAGEALEVVRGRAAPGEFAAAFERVRSAVAEVRRKRRAERAAEAVSDPAAAARRRASKLQRKAESRKRKVAQFVEARPKNRIKRSRPAPGAR
eukprot:tig00000137_g8130.t1